MKYKARTSGDKWEIEVGEHCVHVNRRLLNGNVFNVAVDFADIKAGPFQVQLAKPSRFLGVALLLLSIIPLAIFRSMNWTLGAILALGAILFLNSLRSQRYYRFLGRETKVLLDLPYKERDKAAAERIAQEIVKRSGIQRAEGHSVSQSSDRANSSDGQPE